jgi:hypothetical protein
VATLRAAVKSRLTADATLMAILTGGAKDWDELGDGKTGLTPETAAYNGSILLPQAVLTWGTETPVMESYGTQGLRRFLQLWAYDHDSRATIESALKRARTVLHRARVATDDAGTVLVVFASYGPDFLEDALGKAPGRFARFYIQMGRRN